MVANLQKVVRSTDALRCVAWRLGGVWVGAWGSGPFANDDASDWVYELEQADDLTAVRSAIGAAIDVEYLELPEGSVAIAAAEVIAAVGGSGRQDLPSEVLQWLATADDRLTLADRDLALRAVRRARSADSEIAQLWEEANDPSWAQEVDDLIVRLEGLAG